MPSAIRLEKQRQIPGPAENMVQKMGVGPEDAKRDCPTQEMFSEHRPEAI
jgi:hypothetical protein